MELLGIGLPSCWALALANLLTGALARLLAGHWLWPTCLLVHWSASLLGTGFALGHWPASLLGVGFGPPACWFIGPPLCWALALPWGIGPPPCWALALAHLLAGSLARLFAGHWLCPGALARLLAGQWLWPTCLQGHWQASLLGIGFGPPLRWQCTVSLAHYPRILALGFWL